MVSFFLFRCEFQEKIEPSWRNYLIRTADWGGQQNNSDTQNILIISSAIATMKVIYWTKDNFCFISNRNNIFNCKLNKLINEQVIIFYSASNARCSSDKWVQIKHFKHHTSIGMRQLVQPANTEFLLMKVQWVWRILWRL